MGRGGQTFVLGIATIAAIAAIAASAGCGRVGFDANAATDGGADAPSLGPFGTPTPVTELNTPAAESDPALTGDMLEMYFDSDAAGMTDIYVSKRASTAEPWGPASIVTELSSASFDGAPGVTPDGLTIYVTTSRAGGLGDFDIWRSTRASRADAWSPLVDVPELSTAEDDSNAQPSSDDLTMWMSSKRGGLTVRHLYVATRASTASPWSTPVAISELNTLPTESSEASWADDGYEIYFASNRAGTFGAADIYRAARPALDVPFDPPSRLDELSSSQGEQDPWLSPDRRTVFFMRHVLGGSDDILTATR